MKHNSLIVTLPCILSCCITAHIHAWCICHVRHSETSTHVDHAHLLIAPGVLQGSTLIKHQGGVSQEHTQILHLTDLWRKIRIFWIKKILSYWLIKGWDKLIVALPSFYMTPSYVVKVWFTCSPGISSHGWWKSAGNLGVFLWSVGSSQALMNSVIECTKRPVTVRYSSDGLPLKSPHSPQI